MSSRHSSSNSRHSSPRRKGLKLIIQREDLNLLLKI